MFWRIWPLWLLVPVLPAADLPITEVTLYKHGVAHLERSGELKPGETARLDFKPDDMNDVLKSLTVTDRNGGKVNGVRYDSSDPLEKRLEDFPFRLGAGASLAAFLDQMKGARIELKLGAGDAAGTIISARVVQESDKSQREVLVLLMDSGDIRSFDLGAASAVKLSDPKLQTQLAAYLDGAEPIARPRPAQRVHRRGGFGHAAVDGELHDAGGGVEIELPFDVRRGGRADARRLGDYRQHLRATIGTTCGWRWCRASRCRSSRNCIEPRYVQRPFAELAENQAAAPVVYQGAMEAAAKDRFAAAPKVQVEAQAGALRTASRREQS